MPRQTQRVKRNGKYREVENAVEELPAEETTEEDAAREQLLEDAACCLQDIDEVLDGCKPELTDEEIVELGHPNWSSSYRPEYDYERYDRDEVYKAEIEREFDEAEAQYDEAETTFHEAYERINGVAYEHTGCGCNY